MFQFHNTSGKFVMLQPLDGKDVVPFPARSTLDLDEAQVRVNCRDLSACLRAKKVSADDVARALVSDALSDFREREAAAEKARKAARKG